MKDNILPEEKLLKLIRTNRKPKDIAMPVSGMAVQNKSRKSFPISFPHVASGRVIKLIFFISLFYLIISLIHPIFALKKVKLPRIDTKEKTVIKKESRTKEAIRPYAFYSLGIKQRKIFSSAAVDQEKPIGAVSADLIKDINLVGIISGEDPQAIIEDKKAQKTYYLRKGQFIGELRLEDIAGEKIILNYEGQRYELYL
ncbi:MAG: hypothetical protein WC330_08435 [Candidatus Omnitrophota bacterium]|jgi:type II secretory pathway component PulC